MEQMTVLFGGGGVKRKLCLELRLDDDGMTTDKINALMNF